MTENIRICSDSLDPGLQLGDGSRAMASSRQPDLTALDAAILRFVDDFQSIIRAEVERTVRRALGGQPALARASRKAAVKVPKRAARAARRAVAAPVKAKAAVANAKPARGKRGARPAPETAAKPRRKRAEQLSLF